MRQPDSPAKNPMPWRSLTASISPTTAATWRERPRQRFLLTGTYQLPFGKGQFFKVPGYLNPILGGWNLSTVTTIQTGQWLTPTMNAASDQSNTNLVVRNEEGSAQARPDCVGNPIPSTQTPGDFFNINAFAFPPQNAGRFGNCGVGHFGRAKPDQRECGAGQSVHAE